MKWLNILSTLIALIPILVGFFTYRLLHTQLKLLLFFICYGFVTDLLCWLFFDLEKSGIAIYLFKVFSLVEALFYSWFLISAGGSKIPAKIKYILFPLIFLLWIVITYHDSLSSASAHLSDGTFEIFYQTLLAVMSAYILLKFIETKIELFGHTYFWFVLVIFFYCFNALFLFVFKDSAITSKIWFLQNGINILANLAFAGGYLIVWGRQKRPSLYEY